MTLMYGFLWCAVLLRERRSLALGLLGGAFLALSALTRPVVVPLAPLVALWFLFRLSWAETARRLLPVAALSALIVAPWLARTSSVYGAFVPIATNGGMNFWLGNNPLTIPLVRAGFHPQWIRPDAPIRTEDTRLANDDLYQLSFSYLRENLRQLPELLWVKFLAYWSVDVFPTRNPIPGAMPIVMPDGELRFQTERGETFSPVTIGEADPVAASFADALRRDRTDSASAVLRQPAFPRLDWHSAQLAPMARSGAAVARAAGHDRVLCDLHPCHALPRADRSTPIPVLSLCRAQPARAFAPRSGAAWLIAATPFTA